MSKHFALEVTSSSYTALFISFLVRDSPISATQRAEGPLLGPGIPKGNPRSELTAPSRLEASYPLQVASRLSRWASASRSKRPAAIADSSRAFNFALRSPRTISKIPANRRRLLTTIPKTMIPICVLHSYCSLRIARYN
jgi:hypothetical protein